MPKKKNLALIEKLFSRKKYTELLELFEKEVFRFRDNSRYYSLLGLACLYLNDLAGAFSYLKRAFQLNKDDISVMLGLAAIHLKKRNLDEALNLWLAVLQLDPKNKTAKYALEKVRRGKLAEKLGELIDSGKITRFYPKIKIRPLKKIWFGILFIFLVGLVFGVIKICPELGKIIFQEPTENPKRLESKSFILSPEALRTEINLEARFIFNEAQVDEIWKKVLTYFNNYQDNLMIVELNRLLLSNASNYIKEMSNRLKGYAKTPGFADILNFKNNFTFEEVNKDPKLYDGCFVLWRGTVANLKINSQKMYFSFLVGSYDKRIFEGAVEVVFDFANLLENTEYIELLGKVISEQKGFSLKGILQRKLEKPRLD